MVSALPKQMAAFAFGLDHALWQKHKDADKPDTTWSDWARQGGTWTQDPVAITRVPGEVNIFLVDTDDSLQQANFDFRDGHGLGAWKKLGGKLLGPPAVANSKGTIHIFHIGMDHALYHKAWNGVNYTPEDGYHKLGGMFIHAPVAVSCGHEEVSVFAIGLRDGYLHHYHWKSSCNWRSPVKLPGCWAGPLSVTSHQEGCWDIFGLNPEEKINHVSYRNGKQSNLEMISGLFKTIDAISWGPGRIDLFGWGLDSGVYHKTWEQGSWGGWENLQGVITLRPRPVSHSVGSLCVIGIGTNCVTYIKVRDPNTGTWGPWTDIQGIIISRVA